MEAFIDKGYNNAVLEVLNDIRVYMIVVVLSDKKNSSNKMENWVLAAKQYRDSQWS